MSLIHVEIVKSHPQNVVLHKRENMTTITKETRVKGEFHQTNESIKDKFRYFQMKKI